MEFQEVMKRRYSCRKYAERSVSRDLLLELAEAGRMAPSACNNQHWAFVVVDDREICTAMAAAIVDEELHVNTFAPQIPAYIVVAKHPHRSPNEKQKILLSADDFITMDVGIAAQQICLAATDLGLGTVMLGRLDRERIKEILDMPEELEIGLVIGVGYPAQERTGSAVPRLEPGEVIRLNSYNKRI